MVRPLVIVTAFVSVGFSAFAQQITSGSSPSTHSHLGLAPTQLIDGSVNPEKIPDSTAYRLFFLVAGVPPNPKPGEQARQSAHLDKVGLSNEDNEVLIPILNEFRQKYADLIAQYHQSAQAALAQGQIPDSKSFLVLRDNLVQATRNKLTTLTPDGLAKLDQHIQHEKTHMKSIGPVSN